MFTISVESCDHCGQDIINPLTVGKLHLCTHHYSYYVECDYCGVATSETKVESLSGFNYCPDCLDENFSLCGGCGKYIPNEEKEELGKNCYCEECYEERGLCDHCGDVCFLDDMREVDGEFFCQVCFDHNYFFCYSCSEVFPVDDVHNAMGDDYCPDCFFEEFDTCLTCGAIEGRDDGFFTDNGEFFCEICYEAEMARDCPGLHSYGYKPESDFHRAKLDEKNTPTFGLELEVETTDRENRPDMVEESTSRFTYCKEDGSLSSACGFEVVSHPFTWTWHQEQGKRFWDDLLDTLVEGGCRSYDTGSCGIHINISKASFTTLHLYKFLKFYYENLKFIEGISQRTESSSRKGCQWAARKESLENQKPSTWASKAKSKDSHGRYTAVNLENHATVEVRIFRGTLNKASFHKNIEFVKASFEYSKKCGMNDITVEGFKAYVAKNAQYKHLHAFIERKGL